MRPLPLTPILLVAMGCGPDPLGPGLDERFTHFGGCGDVVFFAVDADDEVMVTFASQGLVAEALEAGVETTTVIELPSNGVELVLEQGSKVSDATCDDVVEGSGPRVRRSWTAASGTATVHIRPLTDAGGGRGDLVLDDVVFTSDGAEDVALDRLEWTDVSVGWFPG